MPRFPLAGAIPKISQEEVSTSIRDLYLNTTLKPVYPFGSGSSGVFILGETPGQKDAEIGEPFTGPFSEILNQELLPSIALGRNDVYLTNVVKHPIPEGKSLRVDEVTKGSEIVLKEIILQKPKLIVCLGRYALEFFFENLKITDVHGKIYSLSLYNDYGVCILPLFNQGLAYRNPEQIETVKSDFLVIREFLDDRAQISELPKQDENEAELLF